MRSSFLMAAFAATLAFGSVAEAKSRLLWEGGFWGGRWVEDPFAGFPGFGHPGLERSSGDRTRTEYRREHRFFRTSRACEAWLYKMRTDWQDMPRYSWCKRVRVEG
jgi:hypothetical protein